jgi:hypothetical protein
MTVYPELTKREYFAAMAMQGFCANTKLNQITFEEAARMSLEQADSLIKALEKAS